MKLHLSTVAGSLALAIPVSLFVYFGHAADRAMDKSGIGDLAAWRIFNVYADFALWSAIEVWFALIGLGLLSKGSQRLQLFGLCGLAPLVAGALWFLGLSATLEGLW